MSNPDHDPKTTWTLRWLDAVAAGSATMSQRKLTSIETRGVGLEATRVLAEARRVHLLLLNDENGVDLVAASTKPFRVVC